MDAVSCCQCCFNQLDQSDDVIYEDKFVTITKFMSNWILLSTFNNTCSLDNWKKIGEISVNWASPFMKLNKKSVTTRRSLRSERPPWSQYLVKFCGLKYYGSGDIIFEIYYVFSGMSYEITGGSLSGKSALCLVWHFPTGLLQREI